MLNASHHFHDVESISVFVDPSLREGEETMTIEVRDKAGKSLRTIVLFFNDRANVDPPAFHLDHQ